MSISLKCRAARLIYTGRNEQRLIREYHTNGGLTCTTSAVIIKTGNRLIECSPLTGKSLQIHQDVSSLRQHIKQCDGVMLTL